MILYIFAIWLVSCYSSSGAPASIASSGAPATNVNNASDYSVALSNLASSCENPFLSAQIKNKLKDCPTLVPPYGETEFQCMLFYDINSQLCSAVASNRIALSGDYIASINAPQDIVQLCDAAKSWTFSSLGEEYTKSTKFVFENVLKCAKICSDDNAGVIDIKSNFYCNYFKWGSDLLHANIKPQTGVATGVAPNSAADSGSNSIAKPVGPTSVVLPNLKKNLTSVPLNVQTSIDNHHNKEVPKLQAIDQKNTSEKATSTNTGNTESHVDMPVEQNPSELLTASDGPKDKAADDKKVKDNENISGPEPGNLPPPLQGHADEVVDKIQKSDKTDEINPKITDVKNENSANDAINSQLQVPKNDLGDGDDYQSDLDSDEGRGLPDAQGIDDGDDPAAGDPDLLKDLDQHKKNNSPQLTDISQKEFYSNGMSDGFPEEDDHFFPFFLTAIIMVVLLYVLYHNKSKVSKVIMGLIVEGRQPGRRRNSRGHAYKRLDTLEQAMSTNSSAPPSKIIY